MDIVLKFGEHYYENIENSIWIQLLISFIGALFGFGFALTLYYFKTKKDKEKEKKDELKESINRIIYYIILIENIITILESQKKRIIEFAKLQRKDIFELKELKQTATNDFIRLHSIDSRGIFEAFSLLFENNTNWITEYRNLNSCLDYLEIVSIDINKKNESNYSEFFNELKRIKNLIDIVPNHLSSLGFELSKKLIEKRWDSEEYIFVDKYIKRYMSLCDNSSNISNLNNEFIIPMHLEISEKLDKFYFAEEFSFYCQEIRRRLDFLAKGIEDNLCDLEKIVTSIDNQTANLIEFKEKIKKRALTKGVFHAGFLPD